MKVLFAAATLLLIASGSAQSASVDCGLVPIARHSNKQRTRIYAAQKGLAAIYYRAHMEVDTDGTARSYHPEDPRGLDRALNNIANAITKIYDASGRDIGCTPRVGRCFERYIRTFEAARAANYQPNGHPRILTTDIIPWKKDQSLGWDVPCTNPNPELAGYFVSQTRLEVDRAKDICDPARYLDSVAIAANVIPSGTAWASKGIRTDDGDIVVTRDVRSGTIAFAVNGDYGPARLLGEGSVALAARLGAVELAGTETYAQVRALSRADVEYLIFPTEDIRRIAGTSFDQADIDRIGADLFAKWGGVFRLDTCQRSLH